MWPYAKQQGHFIRGTLPVAPAFSEPLGSAPLLDDAAVSVPAPTGIFFFYLKYIHEQDKGVAGVE